MSTMSTHPLLIVLLIACLIFVTDACLVCGYDGRQYNPENPASTAAGFCAGVAIATNCEAKEWNTHFYADQWGENTLCRLKCDQPSTCAEEYTNKDPNGVAGQKQYKTLIGQVEMGCNLWPVHRESLIHA
ncbi:uncharacterized protein MELLADRAFT_104393 [Melampsora larici-populina 98AG31]|uniref:Secreted protein n=1 Tax=Melampsora larici-populina (strain 98AG31 / pathotype 3-4-7) TaxID=747676 RepID=F4REJ1_MELLP|nr:uncharacterized protein MELLADRAFT_104393 [Melampsora larici-populina 98AG31]EGG09103.1 secreted protein [Melampsora larici-populina 98AG31]